MNVRVTLSAAGWLLVGASVAVLCAALFQESTVRAALEGAVPAGVLLALAGHLFTQSKVIADAEEKRSAFNLDGFAKAFDHAQSLLSDGNNDREKWIEAARSLAHGEELAKGVTVKEHRRVLELERLKYRGFFHQAIAERPATFFYGTPPLYPTLDEAAKASTASELHNGRNLISSLDELQEPSIRRVWLAAAWPRDYEDPIGGDFSNMAVENMLLTFPELHRHLEHRRMWASAAGVLHKRGENERPGR